jgi:hypothetical protein
MVAAPFTTTAVVRAMRQLGDGAMVRADGSQILIALTAPNRRTARERAVTLAHVGLEVGLRQVTATADEQAAAARDSEARAADQLATLADHTGVADPAPAFQRLEVVVHDLERQSELAAAAGKPVRTIYVSLAENQQAMFELRAQVARHDQLVQAQVRARQQELNATTTRGEATLAARSATVDATVHKIGRWSAFWLAGVAFGLAAIVFVAGGLVRRPQLHFRWLFPLRGGAQSSSTVHAAPRPVRTQPVEQRRVYLRSLPTRERDFYLALGPSRSEDSDVAPSTSLDLTGEEDFEEKHDTGPSPQLVEERSSPPGEASVDAPTALPAVRGAPTDRTGPPGEANATRI